MYEVRENGLRLSIDYDEYPINPREEYSNLGKMICWHSRYDLGDKHQYETPQDFRESTEAQDIFLELPLYLYDHSGITMSTRDFCDRWDSGQVGWIYVTKEEAKNTYGNLSDETKALCRKVLEDEVETYDCYLTGDVYEYFIEDENDGIVDSCGNFYYGDTMVDVVKEMRDNAGGEFDSLFNKLLLSQLHYKDAIAM